MAERSGSNRSGSSGSSRNGKRGGLLDGAPKEEFSEEFQHLLSAIADRVLSSANNRVGGITEKLTGMAEGSDSPVARAVGKAGEKTAKGDSPLKAGLSAAGEGVKAGVGKIFKGKGGGKGGKKNKTTNIIEQIDVGAPISVVYDQWTQFQDFSNFMKKVEGVDQKDEQKLEFKAQVLWSHRTWQATIIEQVPDSRIIWKSSGPKGHVDGAVTFHELTPELTRVVVVLEYHPQGLFERTGNIWRAQGRRARLELKNFQRHVMTQTLLHPDDLEGWRGEIHDSKVTKSNEDAQAEADDQEDDEDYEDDDELADSAEDEEDEDEEDEGEEDEEDEGEEDEDELVDEDEGDEDEGDEEDEEDEEDEDEDDEAEQARSRPARRPRSRRPARSGRR